MSARIIDQAMKRVRRQFLGQRDYGRHIVFGVGLSKTGTSSLDGAMNILGYNTIHYPPVAQVTDQGCHLKWPWWMEDYNSANDLPIAATYKELYELFPEAVFVLTVRDVEAWLESCRKHMTEERTKGFEKQPRLEQARRLYVHMYGQTTFEAEAFRTAYHRHVDGVVDFFANRKPLTVLDVTAGHGWSELCGALGRDVPDLPFPKRNVRSTPNAAPVDVV